MNLNLIGAKLRTNRVLYNIYYYAFSAIIRCLGIFVPCKTNQIIFVSFGGLKYDDSPKEIYLAMLDDVRFKDFNFIWAFSSPQKHSIPKGEKIKIDTIKYFYHLLSSKIWITNSSVERGLSLKKKRNIYLNTWHGSPIKKMGSDLSKENASFTSNSKNSWDVQLAQSEYEADVFSKVFKIPLDRIKVIGLPRNDRLAKVGKSEITKARAAIGLPDNKKIILYAPTFREYEKDTLDRSIVKLHLDLRRWQKELGDDYILLIRAHYDVVNSIDFSSNSFVRNVSSYENLNDLLIASDMLISDYSSIFFDYSILEKPMFCYAYDYDEYEAKRGMYFDIRKELRSPLAITETDLIEEIKDIDFDYRNSITRRFKNKYVTEFGNASVKSLDIIYNLIERYGN